MLCHKSPEESSADGAFPARVHEWLDQMAIANELTIDTSATALDMANAIFGDGITVVSASYSGATVSSGIYSGANTTSPGISPTDSGVILSTGRVTDFTNSSGTTDTNTQAGMGTDVPGGVEDDSQLRAVSGTTTYDGAILNADFIPDGNIITMQFVFSSEEYPEYVNGGVNDAFGVWVNGNFVPLTITTGAMSRSTPSTPMPTRTSTIPTSQTPTTPRWTALPSCCPSRHRSIRGR